MSRKINVNPDHYKVAGRERQGEEVPTAVHKQAYAQQEAALRWTSRRGETALPAVSPAPVRTEKTARRESDSAPRRPSPRGEARTRTAKLAKIVRVTAAKTALKRTTGTQRAATATRPAVNKSVKIGKKEFKKRAKPRKGSSLR